MNLVDMFAKSLGEMDVKTLFAISGACLVEINRRIKEGKVIING